MTNTRIHHRRTNPCSRMSLVLLCLLDFIAQGTLAHAHVHRSVPPPERAALVVASAAVIAATDQAGSDPASYCLLCQSLQAGSAAIPVPALTAPAPVDPGVILPADRAVSGSVAAVSYSWRSRGPPSR